MLASAHICRALLGVSGRCEVPCRALHDLQGPRAAPPSQEHLVLTACGDSVCLSHTHYVRHATEATGRLEPTVLLSLSLYSCSLCGYGVTPFPLNVAYSVCVCVFLKPLGPIPRSSVRWSPRSGHGIVAHGRALPDCLCTLDTLYSVTVCAWPRRVATYENYETSVRQTRPAGGVPSA